MWFVFCSIFEKDDILALNQNNLIYALKDNKIIHISEVESGLKCNCKCPACGESLIARKGQKVIHHFAHQSKRNCEYGYQTSLHLAAKDILSKSKEMVLPEVILDFYKHKGSYKQVKISDSIRIKLDKVELEKKEGDIIPDVIAYSGGKKFYIEIFVTHPVDEKKLNKLRKEDISTIEVDLSKIDRTISKEELMTILVNDCSEKKWIYNCIENKWFNLFIDHSEKKKIIKRHRVNNCPISSRINRGKSFALVLDDCLYCEYCLEVFNDYENEENEYIRCTGDQRLSEISDFNTPFEERIKTTNKKFEAERINSISKGYCPNCNHKLVVKNGKYGEFLGCSNYPYCKFNVNINEDTGEFRINS